MSLKFIALSGTTGVTQNLYVYESGNEMVVVDCGVGFPEAEMYGVDLVIPDFSYIIQNKHKLKGILITHGHEDHLGALPFLLKEVNVPVYATKLVAGFIQEKLNDYSVKNYKLHVFDPDREMITLGSFKAMAFRTSHSVPDSVGFAIDTPEGRLIHVADYKFDWTPVDGRPFDLAKLAILSSEKKILMVASDCLGSTTSGYTESEHQIEQIIHTIVEKATSMVFFTTISSNISRIQQAINAATGVGRKVAFIGRSINSKATIAKKLGYLHYKDEVVIHHKDLAKIPENKRMYIISGSYGQPGSALYRMALGEHEFLSVTENDTVIFSSDPAPPGSKVNVDFVVDKLIEQSVDVHYYDIQEDLHVSGHGSREDIKMLLSVTKPKYATPIGGTVRFMKAFRDLASETGIDPGNVFMPIAGDVIEFSGGVGKKTGNIPVKEVLVDGLGIGDVGNIVLRDRQVLSKDGIAIAIVKMDYRKGRVIDDPEIISRGFVFQGKAGDLLIQAGADLKKQIERSRKLDAKSIRNTSVDFLEKYFFKATGRRPMIIPLVV